MSAFGMKREIEPHDVYSAVDRMNRKGAKVTRGAARGRAGEVTHGEAFLIVGRDLMWFLIASLPLGLAASDHLETAVLIYMVVMALCYCAGSGYI